MPDKILIQNNLTLKEAMKRSGEVGQKELFVVDQDRRLVGALSDGDARKWILKGGSLDDPIDQIFNKSPKFVMTDYEMQEVKKLMLDLRIECVPVLEDDKKVKDVLTWDKVFNEDEVKQVDKLDMPVVIMSGGKGSRLDPFTKVLPKALIPINDKPIVEIIMEKFSKYGINDFYLSVNYKARMIKLYFEDNEDNYNIKYVEEEKPLGTIGSLTLIGDEIKEPFCVTNCDVVIDCDYAELLKFHKENNYDLTLVVCCRHLLIPYGVCEIENGGVLKNIVEKPEHDIFINTGMYIVNHKVKELIPKDQFFDMTDLIAKAQANNYKVGAFPVNEKQWLDVGQWEEYQNSAKMLEVKP